MSPDTANSETIFEFGEPQELPPLTPVEPAEPPSLAETEPSEPTEPPSEPEPLPEAPQLRVNSVSSIKATVAPDALTFVCNITDAVGRTYDCETTARADDPHGLSPILWAWHTEHPTVTVQPYVSPAITADDVDRERERRIDAGFVFEGVLYQSGSNDRENIAGAATAAIAAIAAGATAGDLRWHGGDRDFVWIAKDNTVHPMDARTTLTFGQTAMNHKTAHIFAARALKDATHIPADYAVNTLYWP